MKMLFGLVLVLGFVGCSSKDKKAEAAEAQVVEQKVDKKKAKKVKAVAAAQKSDVAAASAAPAEAAPEEKTTSSSSSSFAAVDGTEKSSVSCSNKGDSRKISILNTADGGCGVVYDKAGEQKTVAVAKANVGYCDNVVAKIKSNLEGAGFDCGGGVAQPQQAAPAQPEGTPTN